MNLTRVKKCVFLSIIICIVFSDVTVGQVRKLSDNEIHWIGNRVFDNECAGEDERLMEWNDGEEFLSLGIGHFIWYPNGKNGPFEESFPEFLRYLRKNRVEIPDWLSNTPSPRCPWSTKEIFLSERNSPKAVELQQFLIETKTRQIDFLIKRLDDALPLMLKNAPFEKRKNINNQFKCLASSVFGIYVLVDYVNFKGLGISKSEQYKGHGWGLMQILSEMQGSLDGVKAIEEFVLIAENMLTRRVKNAPAQRNEQRWLHGWRQRLKTYLDLKVGMEEDS